MTAEQSEEQPKQDSRPQRYGWAPGKYLNKCQMEECCCAFIGDKRAYMCADCAYSLPEPSVNQSPPTTLSEERLLPCPFCGKQPTSEFCSVGVPGMEDCGYWGIDCTCGMSQVHADDEEFAIEKWNNRHAAEQMAQASQEIYILQMLLKDAKCPECDGSGTVVTLDRREQPYQMQCQWCHYKAEALKSLPPAPEKGGAA